MPKTFFAPGLGLMIKIAESYALDPLPIMRQFGIKDAMVADPNIRLPLKQVLAFYGEIAERIDDPNFGLSAAQFWHPSQMGALGYAWMTSETLRTALMRLARFGKVLNDTVNILLKESEGNLSLVLEFANEITPAFRIDAAMAMLLSMLRVNAGTSFHPKEVTFSHPPPTDSGAFYALFQCPVAFASPANSLSISIADADKFRSCSNRQLAVLHDQLLIETMAKLDKENIVGRVEASIVTELASGLLSEALVAKKLHMTERTLQRRLKEQKTSFTLLLNKLRVELANNYVNDSSLSLSEISFLLGFSEMSSFSHAFKRWTGQSPSNYRQAGSND